jgi:ubiquinol-cytochrome c reductase iron-sulfur subunit
MSIEGVNHSRRRFLIAATTVVGGVGAGFVAYPFLASMQPSAKTQAAGAPIEVDVSKLEPGQRLTEEWRGKPVWIVRRTEESLTDLDSQELLNHLRDPNSDVTDQQPEYAKNQYRSIKPEYLVVVGICTHLGCSPQYVRKTDPHSLGENWKGGFFCPCHGSFFDLAGRVHKNVPAPTNLVIPPYTYLSDTRILVGVDSTGGTT